MRRLFIYLLLFIFCFVKNANSQTPLSTLSKLYWNSDLKQLNINLIAYYKENKNLQFYSFDNPLEELRSAGYGNKEDYYKFIFSSNPFFNTDSIPGYIFISTNKTDSTENIWSVKVCFGDFKKVKQILFLMQFLMCFQNLYIQKWRLG
ncbi:MAG: hypothetical protein QM737_18520 [Ferruginibacter sp.]